MNATQQQQRQLRNGIDDDGFRYADRFRSADEDDGGRDLPNHYTASDDSADNNADIMAAISN